MSPLVPVLGHNKVSREKVISYLPLGDALTRRFPTRAVMMAYSLPTHPHRLVREDLEIYGGVPMRLLILDVDDPIAHATHRPSTADWQSAERTKIDAMLADHPGAFIYFTPAGWRAVYMLGEPFVINDTVDEERWRTSYLAIVSELRTSHGIEVDAAGSRWGQCFDLPRAARDGIGAEGPETIGDPRKIGVWPFQIVEPPPARKRGEAIADVGDSLLGREFIRRGMDGKVSRGNLAVVCPWSSEHTSGHDLDGSTVIMAPTTERRRGWFHCSHAHCIGRDAEIFEKLGIVKESANLARLRADLKDEPTEVIGTGPAKRVFVLSEVENYINGMLANLVRSDRLVVARVTLGAGKTRSIVSAATASDRSYVIAVPRHDLGGEIAMRFAAKPGMTVTRRRGVLRVLSADGSKPACQQHEKAEVLQQVGASVPSTLCPTCPHAHGCPARKRGKPLRVTVVPHQLAASAMEEDREHEEVPVLVFDETPVLLRQLLLTRADLAEAARQVVGDLLDPQFADEVAPFVVALTTASADPEHDLLKACAGGAEAEGIVNGTQFFGIVPRFRVDPNQLPRARWTEFVGTTRIFRAVLAAQEVKRIAWRSDGLAVHADTPEVHQLRKGGAIILDATPPLDTLAAVLTGSGVTLWCFDVDVADGALIERLVIYSPSANRSKLAPDKMVDPGAVARVLALALDECGHVPGRILVATHKVVADWLRSARPAEVLGTRPDLAKVLGERVDIAHYGAVRGLDRWKDNDACVTLGDAWPTLNIAEEQARALGLDPETYGREVSRAELAQVHGRLRDPSRSRPAKHVHVGTTAPLRWTTQNTTIDVKPPGRPRTKATVSTKDLGAWVALHGQRKAASFLGIHRRTLRRYLKGRSLPANLADRVTQSDYVESSANDVGALNPSKTSLVGITAPTPSFVTSTKQPLRSKPHRASAIDDARYAYRKRYVSAIDGGASERVARRLALAAVPGFNMLAWAGCFDLERRSIREQAAW